MSEHYDGLLRQSVSDEYPEAILEARSKNLANIYYNYLQFFPILSVVFRGETHSTRNTPRGCTELLMVPTRKSPALLGALCGRMQVPVTLEALHV